MPDLLSVEIKRDFPMLAKTMHGKPLVYLEMSISI